MPGGSNTEQHHVSEQRDVIQEECENQNYNIEVIEVFKGAGVIQKECETQNANNEDAEANPEAVETKMNFLKMTSTTLLEKRKRQKKQKHLTKLRKIVKRRSTP